MYGYGETYARFIYRHFLNMSHDVRMWSNLWPILWFCIVIFCVSTYSKFAYRLFPCVGDIIWAL